MTYQDVLTMTHQLSVEQKLLLADTILAETLGFGMWRNRTDMTDVNAYVEHVRAEQMCKEDGQLKSPEEFLRWVESDDE